MVTILDKIKAQFQSESELAKAIANLEEFLGIDPNMDVGDMTAKDNFNLALVLAGGPKAKIAAKLLKKSKALVVGISKKLPPASAAKAFEVVDPSIAAKKLAGEIAEGGAVKVGPKGANIAGQEILKKAGLLKYTTNDLLIIAKIHIGKYGGKLKNIFNMLRRKMGDTDMASTLKNPKIQEFDIGSFSKKSLQAIFNPTVRTLGVSGVIATIGADSMVTWMLSDNIPFIATSLGNKIEWKVRNGDYTTIEDYHGAYRTMQIAEDSMKLARTKIDNLWNPFTKKYQAEYTANLDQADELMKMSKDVLEKGAKEFIKQMLDPQEEKMRTFMGVERTEEESTIQEQSFERAEQAQEEKKRQAEADIRREEAEGRRSQQAQMRSQVGIGALARGPPQEQKKREVPSKIKFGL